MESTAKQPQVTDVRFEHYLPQDNIGIGEARPRISWKISNAPQGFKQKSYHIELYEQSNTAPNQLYESVNIESSDSVLVPWPSSKPLRPRQRLYTRVRVVGEGSDEPTEWSDLVNVEAGLLSRDDWHCHRIAAEWTQDPSVPRPEELYRKVFAVRPKGHVKQARLYITAQGVYEAQINGKRVGDHFMAPGWTAYAKRLQYQTYDVSELLNKSEENCIGVRVAEGWFCGRLSFGGGRRNLWGDHTALLAQLEIDFDDGSRDVVGTDDSWDVTEGPARLAEIYHGEKYDSSFEIPGWSTTELQREHTGRAWSKAKVLDFLPEDMKLISMTGGPVRRMESIAPIEKIITPQGKVVLDFGQNLVGYSRIKSVKGPKDHVVSLYHAEVLEHGELGRRPLRDAHNFDQYTLKGDPEGETWEPAFTFHGYRYVQVDDWPDESPDIMQSLEAVVCHTDMQHVGDFSCSDRLLNKLHSNVRWGMRGNFLSVPTDCPQRDERLGWSGDLALFAPTASFLYDCFGMLKGWLADVSVDQEVLKGIPAFVTPNVLLNCHIWSKAFPCAIWCDVTILAPWTLYEATGDTGILADQYPSMISYLNVLPRNTSGDTRLWDSSSFQLGDWLDPTAPAEEPDRAQTNSILVADAFLVRCLSLMAKIAAVLGHTDDTRKFADEAEEARKAFAAEYITPNGRMTSDAQTAYALAICFNLFPTTAQRAHAGTRLAHIIRLNAFRIGTGFAGTPYVCEALALTGHTQVAYRMLLEKRCPSWLYPVTMGATTVWERWDSMMPDGTVNPGEMTSFNHYALGAVATFLHERLAGLKCLEPGWRKSRAEPLLGGDFTCASTSHLSPYGIVSCAWEIVGEDKEKTFKMKVQVPSGTTMEVILPKAVTEGDDDVSQEQKRIQTIGVGEWTFELRLDTTSLKKGWPPKAIPRNPFVSIED